VKQLKNLSVIEPWGRKSLGNPQRKSRQLEHLESIVKRKWCPAEDAKLERICFRSNLLHPNEMELLDGLLMCMAIIAMGMPRLRSVEIYQTGFLMRQEAACLFRYSVGDRSAELRWENSGFPTTRDSSATQQSDDDDAEGVCTQASRPFEFSAKVLQAWGKVAVAHTGRGLTKVTVKEPKITAKGMAPAPSSNFILNPIHPFTKNLMKLRQMESQ
jgi:hypothetical protein